jgi:hypothetical protein
MMAYTDSSRLTYVTFFQNLEYLCGFRIIMDLNTEFYHSSRIPISIDCNIIDFICITKRLDDTADKATSLRAGRQGNRG